MDNKKVKNSASRIDTLLQFYTFMKGAIDNNDMAIERQEKYKNIEKLLIEIISNESHFLKQLTCQTNNHEGNYLKTSELRINKDGSLELDEKKLRYVKDYTVIKKPEDNGYSILILNMLVKEIT